MATMEWPEKKILFFIEVYRRKPILWDPWAPGYYNKLKRDNAWDELADKLDSTHDECKRKMASLMASFRREKAKIAKSKAAGKGAEDQYKTSWFAFKALAFVLDRNKRRTTTNDKKAITEMEENMDEEVQERTTEIDAIDESTRYEDWSNDPLEPPPAKKSKKNPEEMLESAYTILQNVAQTSTTTTRLPMDECESYGLYVSNKLKTYSTMTRNTVQHHFSNILFKADQGRYDVVYPQYVNYEHQTTPSPQPSHSLGKSEEPEEYFEDSDLIN